RSAGSASGEPAGAPGSAARRGAASTRRSAPHPPRRGPRAPAARPPARGPPPRRDRTRTPPGCRARRGSRRAPHPPAARLRPAAPVPVGQEAAEGGLLDRLDFLPERGERSAAQPSQHVRVAPLALRPTRAELAADELLRALELVELGRDVAAEAPVCLGGRERA